MATQLVASRLVPSQIELVSKRIQGHVALTWQDIRGNILDLGSNGDHVNRSLEFLFFFSSFFPVGFSK
jgi:hypothetical protein